MGGRIANPPYLRGRVWSPHSPYYYPNIGHRVKCRETHINIKINIEIEIKINTKIKIKINIKINITIEINIVLLSIGWRVGCSTLSLLC